MGKGKRNRDARKTKAAKQYSTLQHHKQVGKVLQPPFLTISGMQPSSWSDDRLPEMLWCALLITHLPRELALEIFRRCARVLKGSFEPNQTIDIGHSGLTRLPDAQRSELLALICSAPGAREVLRPLSLLEKLPGVEAWRTAIGMPADRSDWELLRLAVAHVFDHQSEEATDCRWFRLLVILLSGQLKLQTEQQVKEIINYPHEGDLRSVRPFIRAAEISFANMPGAQPEPWPHEFWDQCWRDTGCIPKSLTPDLTEASASTTLERLSDVSDALAKHFLATATTTSVDARHETVFGFAAYSLSLLRDLVRLGNSTAIVARLGLRGILETRVLLAYLLKRDSVDLWNQYRAYGAGQTKLAFLKLDDDAAEKVGFVNAEVLGALANEDRSAEFVSINVGNWEGSNLRKMSEEAGVKADYDRFYPWTSAYMHANWGAVRASNFDVCLNALHRLHRVLRPHALELNDVVSDACELTDKILAAVDATYAPFPHRVTTSSV